MLLFNIFKKLFKNFFNFFRKKKKPEKKPEIKPRAEVKPEEKKPEKLIEVRPRSKKRVAERAYKVLHSPHIAEKATDFEKENKYVFKVWPKANKIEIKKAIEDTYGVYVEKVKIINIHRRRKRLGRQMGWKKGYKKAIIKVKEGQKIEILPR